MKKILYIAITAAVVGSGVFGVLMWLQGTNTSMEGSLAEGNYKVGILVRGASYLPGIEGFQSQMTKLGYKEGTNIEYMVEVVTEKSELAGKVTSFLDWGADLIHTYSTPATLAVYAQSKEIPIVFGSMGDPLRTGMVDSIQRPGKNVTGVQSMSVALVAKRLEFLVEAVPSVKRVAFPVTLDDIPGQGSYEIALEIAPKLGIELVPYYITQERDSIATARAIKKEDVDGIVISSDTAVWSRLSIYIDQAIQEKLPFAVFDKDMVAKGGLLGYGPDYFGSGEQSAVYADKILQGANPADLPIDSPRKLLLAINNNTAAAIGIDFPQDFLKKADVAITDSP